MRDACGRTFDYLRLSLTRRCNLRCLYCRPPGSGRTPPGGAQDAEAAPRAAPLGVEECAALVGHLVRHHGLRKVRLTGGEPTCRGDLPRIIHRLARLPRLHEVTLTTNGLTLARTARTLADAGLRRVNVSLDALDPHVFARMTGAAALPRVLAGIAAARRAGLAPVKLNTVVMRGINDGELPRLVRFAAAAELEIRFIELMPMGPLAAQWAQRHLPESEMRARLDAAVAEWRPLVDAPTGAARRPDSARRYRARLRDGGVVTVGFITPMSCAFCQDCNRMRITADGQLYPCLMGPPAGSLLPAVRPQFDGDRLDALLARALAEKPPVHPAAGAAVMSQLGG